MAVVLVSAVLSSSGVAGVVGGVCSDRAWDVACRRSGARTRGAVTRALGRCDGPMLAGGGRLRDAGLEPWFGESVLVKRYHRQGYEEEACGVMCLCVCEAFTSNTLAVKFWFPS